MLVRLDCTKTSTASLYTSFLQRNSAIAIFRAVTLSERVSYFCLAFSSCLRAFVVRFSVLQFASSPMRAGSDLGITAERPLHVFTQAAVGNVLRVYLQAVRQSRIFG